MPPHSPHDDGPDGVRLQKLLSTAGVASRRASEQLIIDGRVTVNGEVVRTLGARATTSDDIRVDGRRVRMGAAPRYILLFKPRGYVTTRHDPEGRPTVLELLDRRIGYVYPVGRLDYDSEGLLLLTSDGDLAERLMHPRHEVPKVYEAIVIGTPDPVALDKLRAGVFIDGQRTSPAEVVAEATIRGTRPTTRLTITLREGRNRQVRKMCQVVGLPVRDLRRVRIGSLGIGQMRPGDYRELTPAEIRVLQRDASGAPGTGPDLEGEAPRPARPPRRPPFSKGSTPAWDKSPAQRHRTDVRTQPSGRRSTPAMKDAAWPKPAGPRKSGSNARTRDSRPPAADRQTAWPKPAGARKPGANTRTRDSRPPAADRQAAWPMPPGARKPGPNARTGDSRPPATDRQAAWPKPAGVASPRGAARRGGTEKPAAARRPPSTGRPPSADKRPSGGPHRKTR